MEPAKIDWKKVESIFVEDKLYENINAPKWFDFLNNSQDSDNNFDDEAWFCRPDCNHPKTVEDFIRANNNTPNSKFSKSPLGSWNSRDSKLKLRGHSSTPVTPSDRSKFSRDCENHNPNSSTPPSYQVKGMKPVIKSNSEKKRAVDDLQQRKEPPRLKATLSARNLFAGKDILSHIGDFCTELKKMAMRARERENDEKEIQVGEKKDKEVINEGSRVVLGELKAKQKETKPLLEAGKEKSDRIEKGSSQEKQGKKKIIVDAENIPVPLNLEHVKHKGEERLQIRTNPPSPQCFSATRPPTRTTPSKSSKSRLMERGILQEVKQNKEVMIKEDTSERGKNLSIVDGREAKALDVFWFLKPCTMSG